MKVRCPECAEESDLGPNGLDDSDTSYRLRCPHVRAVGASDTNFDCPHMHRVRDAALRKAALRQAKQGDKRQRPSHLERKFVTL